MKNAVKLFPRISLFCLLALCGLLTSAKSVAQSTYGMIIGRVSDASGAVVSDAKVEALNQATGETRDAITDSVGEYRFLNVEPGHDVLATAADATAALQASRFEIVVLDLGLPDADGLEVLGEMRRRRDATPVLILTARGSLKDRVAGLGDGADDYLVKPFALEELIARLRALLRRPGNLLGVPLELGNVTLDTVARQVFVSEEPIFFSPREIAVLEHLLRRSGRVVGKNLLENNLYGGAVSGCLLNHSPAASASASRYCSRVPSRGSAPGRSHPHAVAAGTAGRCICHSPIATSTAAAVARLTEPRLGVPRRPSPFLARRIVRTKCKGPAPGSLPVHVPQEPPPPDRPAPSCPSTALRASALALAVLEQHAGCVRRCRSSSRGSPAEPPW